MAGGWFSRKSKNGVGTPVQPEAVLTSSETLYDPMPAPQSMRAEPPDAIPGIPDLYGVLGVDTRASDDIIRYAYRKKAAKLLDARWRPGRAARRLAELNAAYEILGKPDRRADYDRQRARLQYYHQAALQERMLEDPTLRTAEQPLRPDARVAVPVWMRPRAPRGILEAIAIVGVVLVVVYAGYTVFGNGPTLSLGGLQDAGAALGLPFRSQPVATATPSPAPVLPAPTPRQVIVPPVAVPSPSVAATPVPAASPSAAAPLRSSVRVSNPTPPRNSEINVVMRLTRDNRPVIGAPVHVVVHYKTIDERFPLGGTTVPTNEIGEAMIVFNIGDATAGFPVNVDVIATVEGETHQAQTAFLPR